jgi:hypothetical protein
MDPTVGYWPVKETSQWPLSGTPAAQSKDMRDGFGYDDATLPHTHTTYAMRVLLSRQPTHRFGNLDYSLPTLLDLPVAHEGR